MIEESTLLERLRKADADGIVYASQLRRKERLYAALNRYSMAERQTPAQWLGARGLTWAETGYVELDMRPKGKAAMPGGFEAYDVAHFVFRKYPLVGTYILTPEEDRLLYQASKKTIKQFLRADYSADRKDCVVLVLEAVRMIRGWNWPDRSDKFAESAFWRYLFKQFGIHTENSTNAEERLLDGFTMAIESVMEFYRRFAAPAGSAGRLQYSATLLLHALSPREEMESLFQVLFNFYADTLHYQYRAGDVGFGALVDELLKEWEEEAERREQEANPNAPKEKKPKKSHKIGRPRKEDLFERAPPAISELHTLFRYRPEYAVALCDELVKKMDILLREESALDVERDYRDLLLKEWYHKKSGAERVRIQEGRKAAHTEYVAVSGATVAVRYGMDNGRVGLSVPAIRLPVVDDARPTLRVYQGDALVFSETLDASGAVLTTKGRFIPLDAIKYDFSQSPELSAEVEYMGGLLYQSGEELRRDWLMFDEAGNQRIPKSGAAWLFAGETQELSIVGGDPQRCDFPGQLYRMQISGVERLSVDGHEVFSASVSRFRHHTSQRRLDLARADAHGRLCDLLPAPFQLLIRMTERDRAARYRVSADGEEVPKEQLEIGRNEIMFTPPDAPQVPHCVQVHDQNGVLKDEYNYMILPNCRVSLDQRLYREAVDEAAIQFAWNGRTRSYALPLPAGMDSVSVTLPGLPYPIEIDAPVVHCSFRGRNAFSFHDAVWHGSVDPSEILTLRLPSGWNGQMMLGVQMIPADETGTRFALGEFLAQGGQFGDEAPLWISLWDGAGPNRRLTYPLMTITFKPSFLRGPLEVENEKLLWQAEENFVGDAASKFQIACTRPDGSQLSFSADTHDADLADSRGWPEGRYDYQIRLDDAAPDADPLYSGSVIIGDPRKFAFIGKQIVIIGALCWDFDADDLKSVPMEEGCGILRDLRYNGESLPPGESVQTPEYVARLYYMDLDVGELLAFRDRADDYFEQVNPVTVWTINEHLLILQSATGDTLYIDNDTATILYRNPDSVMSRDEQRERLETPDYFEYRIEDAPDESADEDEEDDLSDLDFF